MKQRKNNGKSYHDKTGEGPGYEYWSPRPTNYGCGTGPGKHGGKEIKKITHRLERRIANMDLRKEIY